MPKRQGILEPHDEGVVELLQNFSLHLDARHLVSLEQQLLLDDLHGKDLRRIVVLHQVHFAVGAFADGLQDAEVGFLHGRFGS